MSPGEAAVSGVLAAFRPESLPLWPYVVVIGLGLGRHASGPRVVVQALLFATSFAVASAALPDFPALLLTSPGASGWLVAGGLLATGLCMATPRGATAPVAIVLAVVAGVLVAMLRVPVESPAAAILRGGWRSSPALAGLLSLDLGKGLMLGLGIGVGACLGRRWAWVARGAGWLLVGGSVLLVTGGYASVARAILTG